MKINDFFKGHKKFRCVYCGKTYLEYQTKLIDKCFCGKKLKLKEVQKNENKILEKGRTA